MTLDSFIDIFRYFRSLILHCDVIDSISMRFDDRRFRRHVNQVRKMKDDRETDKERSASNARQASAGIHRCKECRFELFDFD